MFFPTDFDIQKKVEWAQTSYIFNALFVVIFFRIKFKSCSGHLKKVEESCIRMCFSFLFAQKIVEMGWAIYHIKSVSVVI